MKYSVKYEEYCERRGEAVTLSNLDNDELDIIETQKMASVLVHVCGWVAPGVARIMVADNLACRRDLMVRNPAGKMVRIQVIELAPDIQAWMNEADQEDEEEGEQSALPRGMKRWVVTEAFVRRHSEAEFAAMLRRVKWVW